MWPVSSSVVAYLVGQRSSKLVIVGDVQQSVRSQMYFRNPSHQEQFEQDGFLRVEFLAASALEELLGLWNEVAPDSLTGIYSNVHDLEPEVNRRIDSMITGLFEEPLRALMDGVFLGGSSFLAKGVGPDSGSTPHQDWNNVDESTSLSLSIWCPLIDVDERNGALQVLPGTHRMRRSLRSLDTDSLYLDFDNELARYLRCVPAEAGDAVFYAHNLFHGSKANMTDQIRVAAVSGVLATDATNVHHRRLRGKDDVFEVFAVNRDFYFGGIPEMAAGLVPESACSIGEVTLRDHKLARSEVLEFVAAHQGLDRG